jgi:GTP pyrophosphokinase
VRLGREILAREWKKIRKKPDEDRLVSAAQTLGLEDGEALLAAVARGDLGITRVVRATFPDIVPEQPPRAPSPLHKLVGKVWSGPKGVRIQGMDDLVVRYSQCCQPVPGDAVMGYITRGRGISIHRQDCPNVLHLSDDPERRVEIEWDTDGAQRFLVRVLMEGTDRHGLFADIARAVSDTGTNIQSADVRAVEGGMKGQFVVEVEHLKHLEKVMREIRRVKGVLSVERKESFGESDLTLDT